MSDIERDAERGAERDADRGDGSDGEPAEVIRVAAALIVDEQGRILLVRKRGTDVFMQPGGKYEPGETAAQTLSRELDEELGVVIAPDQLEPLGDFVADAANEAGARLEAAVLRATLTGPVAARAEIDELRWVHPDEFGALPIAPLVTAHMVPYMQVNTRIELPPMVPTGLSADAPANFRAARMWLTISLVVSAVGVVLMIALPDLTMLGVAALVVGVLLTAASPHFFRAARRDAAGLGAAGRGGPGRRARPAR